MEDKKLESEVFYTKVLNTKLDAKTFNITDYVEWYHNQDCCENVYIDFEHIDTYRNMIDAIGIIYKIELATAPEDWFIFYIYNDEDVRYGIYLPCRNCQNWYYSDDLELILKIDWEEHKFDLQELWCVKDEID